MTLEIRDYKVLIGRSPYVNTVCLSQQLACYRLGKSGTSCF